MEKKKADENFLSTIEKIKISLNVLKINCSLALWQPNRITYIPLRKIEIFSIKLGPR